MKAKEVLDLLRVTRTTLCSYVKQGYVTVSKLPNGQYSYNPDSVYAFLNKGIVRKSVIYARVSTAKQKKDLVNQVELLKQYCFSCGVPIGGIYTDIASGISFEKREALFQLIDEIMKGKIATVYISYKDRLSRVGFELFLHLFKKFGVEIVVISEVGSAKLDSAEVFEEIVSLLHCYSMKLYSNRRKPLVEKLCLTE